MRELAIVAVLLSILGTVTESLATKVNFEDWSHDKPCGRRLANPTKTTIAGCELAYCVNTSVSSQVCACLPSTESDDAKMIYKKDGTVVLQWADTIYPPSGESGLRIDAADLNGNGKEEFVIATLSTVSNGMGVEYWKVRVLSEGKISEPVEVEDYGSMGFLSSNGKQCRLLVTRWIEGWEPKKEYGLYLVGRWFELSDHNLQYTIYRPAIKRRYLDSLVRLRREGSQRGTPIIWFKSPEATPIIGPYPFRN
jgi:hypothetical protein